MESVGSAAEESFLDGDEKRFFLGDFFGLEGYLSFADQDPVLTSLQSGLGESEWRPPNL